MLRIRKRRIKGRPPFSSHTKASAKSRILLCGLFTGKRDKGERDADSFIFETRELAIKSRRQKRSLLTLEEKRYG
jgi:hypothetical protein